MVEVQAKPSGARFVALGMLLSKLGGLVREMILARFFGVGPHADVFRSAMRAPNALQNLLGEQTLSAAFIPFYSRLLAEGRREEAGRFAGAVFGLLVAVVSVLVVAGVVLAPTIVSVLAAGFAGDAVEVAAGQKFRAFCPKICLVNKIYIFWLESKNPQEISISGQILGI